MHQTMYSKVHLTMMNTRLCEHPILPFVTQVTPHSNNFVEILDCLCIGQYVLLHHQVLFIIHEFHYLYNCNHKSIKENTVLLIYLSAILKTLLYR